MGRYGDYVRWMYRRGRPNAWARWQNRASAAVYAAGVWPRRAAALEVRGRKSGRVISFPIVVAEHDGERYLVSMLGEKVNWVRNVLAADGEAVLRHGRSEPFAWSKCRSPPGHRSAALPGRRARGAAAHGRRPARAAGGLREGRAGHPGLPDHATTDRGGPMPTGRTGS